MRRRKVSFRLSIFRKFRRTKQGSIISRRMSHSVRRKFNRTSRRFRKWIKKIYNLKGNSRELKLRGQ